MAAPVIFFKYNDVATDTSATNWITIAGGEVITFTGAGSSDGDLKPIQRPDATGNAIRIADDCWINKGTDAVIQLYDAGGIEVATTGEDIFNATPPSNTNTWCVQTDTNPETQAAEFEAWDDTNYDSTDNPIINGTSTTLIGHSQLRVGLTGNDIAPATTTAGTIPAAYLTQFGTTTTHQVQGSTRIQTAAGANSAGNQNRFTMHLFIVDDSIAGADVCELTYRYFYT